MKYTHFAGSCCALLCCTLFYSAQVQADSQLIPNLSTGELKSNETIDTVAPENTTTEQTFINQFLLQRKSNKAANGAGLLASTGHSESTEADSTPMYNITLGYKYNDALTVSASEHWYLFSSAEAGKVTAFITNIPTGVTYEAYMFSKPLNASASEFITEGASSTPNAQHQQISAIATSPRDYILVVRANGSVSDSMFNVGTEFSTVYDTNEPNDNFGQATEVEAMTPITGELDNNYDIDVYKFTQPTQKNLVFNITGGDYSAVLYNSNGQKLKKEDYKSDQGYLETLPAGEYYFSVSSPSRDVIGTETYILSSTEYLAQLSLQLHSDQYAGIWINYGYGDYFAFYEKATLKGQALNKEGQPLAGAKLEFILKNNIDGISDNIAFATTDENGNYTVEVKSPAGYGVKVFPGPKLNYFYDLHTLGIAVNYGSFQASVPKLIVQEVRGGSVSDEYTTTKSGFIYYDVATMRYR